MEKMRIKVNGKLYDVEVEFLGGEGMAKIPQNNRNTVSQDSPVSPRPAAHASGNGVTSPIAGVVKEIKVKPGDNVTEGQVVVVVEAMKMNTNVLSEYEGKVSAVKVNAGDSVKTGQLLIEF